MEFADVRAVLADRGFMTPWQGRQVYDHLRAVGARSVLELGTAHGVSAAYMAAAVAANGGGTVTTVDRYHFADPSPEETLAEAGLAGFVTVVRTEHSSYDWWLKERIEERSDADANCEPAYDFCYLDGSHDWHIDGLAVVLVERLLRPGAWLLMDDLDWTHAASRAHRPPDLSETELTSPPLRAVWDVVVRAHPAFTQLRLQDEAWGWAQKAPGEPRRYRTETAAGRARILRARLRLALARLRRAGADRFPRSGR
jgi:predicted O-methyltransferase YrrM